MSGCINAVCRGKEIRAATARGSVDSAPVFQREGLTHEDIVKSALWVTLSVIQEIKEGSWRNVKVNC